MLHAARPLVVDLAATLSFYILLAATGDIRLATLFGMALGLCQIGWALWRRQPIAAMQWANVALVVAVGGVTLLLHDARPVLFQVSIIYLIVGAAMLQPGWILRYVPPIAAAHLPRRLVVASGFVWAALIIGTGLLNLVLTLTMPARSVAQVMGLWAPCSKLVLFAGQYLAFRSMTRRAIGARLRAAAAPPDPSSPS